MIRITIELIPPLLGGKEKSIIAKAFIVNDGTGTPERGNYNYALWLKRKKPWRTGKLLGFPKKSCNVWRLVHRILNEI